jgi:environmental stress-induced protein Ves
VQVLRFSSLPVLAWKNGLGSTREVARSPDGAHLDDFDWRISIADVASSGRFSSFPDVERCIVLCQGSAMSLLVDGSPHELLRNEPFWFAGEASTTCTIGAEPTRDVNVMIRRGRCTAEVSVISGGAELAGGGVGFLLALADTDVLDSSGAVIARLLALDVLPLATAIRLPEHTQAIIVTIRAQGVSPK